MPESVDSPHSLEVTVSSKTLWRIAVALLLGFLLLHLAALGVILFSASVLAVTLDPLLQFVLRRGWPRWLGVLLCALVIVAIVGGVIGILIPTVTGQGRAMIEKLPAMREDVLKNLPPTGSIRSSAEQLLSGSGFSDPASSLKTFATWGGVALEWLADFAIAIILAIYFIAQGEQVYLWLVAFVPRRHRPKMDETADEVAKVVRRWLTGQAICSTIAAVFAFSALTLLHVPNATLLAVFAAVFDLIPFIGVILWSIPAMASALMVSPSTALIVGALYVGYHLVESYFIVPKVFGDQLRLSTIAVLIACVAASLVAGPASIVFVLPIVASYPVIEKIWLAPYLTRDAVEKHEELAEEKPSPEQK